MLLGSEELLAQYVHQGEQSDDFTVTLNDVTLANQIKWTAQAIVAPERLSGLVPFHVYRLNQSNLESVFSAYESAYEYGGSVPEPDWHVGVAIRDHDEHSDRNVWRARPILRGQIGNMNFMERNDYFIVSNIPLEEFEKVENLWVPERDWQEGLLSQEESSEQ